MGRAPHSAAQPRNIASSAARRATSSGPSVASPVWVEKVGSVALVVGIGKALESRCVADDLIADEEIDGPLEDPGVGLLARGILEEGGTHLVRLRDAGVLIGHRDVERLDAGREITAEIVVDFSQTRRG